MTLRLRPVALAILLASGTGAASAADLLQAYELARQSDPQLAAADSGRLAVREGVTQSRAALLPQVNGSYGYSETDSDATGTQFFGNQAITSDSSTDRSGRQWGVRLDQSLYDHANYTRLRGSKSRAEQSDYEYDAAADALMVRVAEAYFNVLTAIETLVSSRAEEAAVKRQLDQAEKRLEVGLAPITDVHEARARYDSARANTILSENALDDARETLSEITGQPLSDLRGLPTDFQPQLPMEEIEHWVRQAIDTNPTLKARELAVEAARQDVNTARAGHYPTVSAFVDYGESASWGDFTDNIATTTSPFNNEGDDTVIGVQLNVPIFAGGATQSRVRQSIHERDVAADQFEGERRAVTRNTRNAYRAVVAGMSEVEARRQAVVSARAAYEATEAGLEVGTRTIVDVLITQQQLYLAQRELARARNTFVVDGLRLLQSAGTIELRHMEEVNRLLVADTEALLERTGEDGLN